MHVPSGRLVRALEIFDVLGGLVVVHDHLGQCFAALDTHFRPATQVELLAASACAAPQDDDAIEEPPQSGRRETVRARQRARRPKVA